jgi:hypothetical protein
MRVRLFSSAEGGSDRPTLEDDAFSLSSLNLNVTFTPHNSEAISFTYYHLLLSYLTMRSTSAKLVVAAALAGKVQAAVVEHWWNITWTDANPDGVSFTSDFTRDLI